jgi:general secretion pathway protein C
MISLRLPGPNGQRRIAGGLNLLMAVLLAWVCARGFWLVFAPPTGAPAATDNAVAATPSRLRQARVEIGRYHLFGPLEVNAAVAAWHDAPETALNVQLRGIVSSSDPESGFAIIVAGGRQALFGLGQELPGGAEVRGIYPDRVVLFHAGRYETLRLPVERSAPAAAAGAAAPRQSANPSLPTMAALSSVKEGLSLRLDSAAQYSLIPVKGGGYRLFLGRDARQIADLGLRNGDVIRSANGIALDSQQDVEQVIAKVLGGETLNLLIQRDGAELSLTPDIEQFVSGVR